MGRAKQPKSIDKFQNAVGYLAEYSGVRGVVITDREGLVLVGRGAESPELERYAAYALEIIKAVRSPFHELLKSEIEHLVIKTSHDWLTIAVSVPLMLVVVADRQADDLLHIRITRSLEMISSYVREKYSFSSATDNSKAKNAKSLEAIYV
jgi:predicted regulator of Ras-like GTPase activity (Roadblock/LC7/MglB family)